MSEEEKLTGKCFLCKKKGRVYETKVRGRKLLMCKKHHKEYNNI
jgi:hypothetical protein